MPSHSKPKPCAGKWFWFHPNRLLIRTSTSTLLRCPLPRAPRAFVKFQDSLHKTTCQQALYCDWFRMSWPKFSFFFRVKTAHLICVLRSGLLGKFVGMSIHKLAASVVDRSILMVCVSIISQALGVVYCCAPQSSGLLSQIQYSPVQMLGLGKGKVLISGRDQRCSQRTKDVL